MKMLRLFAVALLALALSQAASAAGIQIGSASGAPGENVQVGVQIDAAEDVAGLNLRVEYDASVLTAPSASAGALLDAAHAVEYYSPTPGVLNVVVYAATANTAFAAQSGEACVLSFQIDAAATDGQSSSLAFAAEEAGPPAFPGSGLASMEAVSLTHTQTAGSVSVLEDAVTPTPTPTPEEFIRTLIRRFYNRILDREPTTAEIDAWQTGYFDYAMSFDIDVRFVPREMSRIFFLSEEYELRTRSDSDFIGDCYNTFLDRMPSQAEIDAWTSGVWNRPQVMTLFAESQEFADLIATHYTQAGASTRNFVSTMYIGLLDRLVDEGGLTYFAGLFNDAYASGGVDACRAEAKTMGSTVIASDEFLAPGPTNRDYVVRFYRAYLGRFPSDSEINYWVGELDAGTETYASLIDQFADAQEFTTRLQQYFN